MSDRPEWLGDDAHNACRSWLTGWRQTHGDDVPPPMGLARDVGDCARRLSAAGVPRVDLARLMWAAGRDGVTAPDLDPAPRRAA